MKQPAQPEVLVDIGRIEGLREVRADGDWLAIGALTTHTQAWRTTPCAECPVLAETAALIGDPQVRNQGTIGAPWPMPTRPPTTRRRCWPWTPRSAQGPQGRARCP